MELALSAGTFAAVFVLLVSEKLDKTVAALLGAAVLMLSGLMPFERAIESIDFETICLLMGMMICVEVLRDVKIFDWIALRMGVATKGNALSIFLVFSFATALLSAFLDNVTTVLVMVPLVISLAKLLGIKATPFVLSLIFFSNIGGTWTLIGDPPNILIGSQVPSLTFVSFIQYLTIPVWITIGLSLVALRYQFRKEIVAPGDDTSRLFLASLLTSRLATQLAECTISKSTVIKSCVIFGGIIIGFLTHTFTHLPASVIALTGAALLLTTFKNQVDVHHVIGKLEWTTLVFFSALFVLVGALEHAGALEIVAHFLGGLTNNLLVMILVLLFASAVISGVVDNIPYVAVMIPVTERLISEQFAADPRAHLLWWALSLGACFGGNLTIFGASANVVSVGIARGQGIQISFVEFFKHAVPVVLLSLTVSALYLTALYYLL